MKFINHKNIEVGKYYCAYDITRSMIMPLVICKLEDIIIGASRMECGVHSFGTFPNGYFVGIYLGLPPADYDWYELDEDEILRHVLMETL